MISKVLTVNFFSIFILLLISCKTKATNTKFEEYRSIRTDISKINFENDTIQIEFSNRLFDSLIFHLEISYSSGDKLTYECIIDSNASKINVPLREINNYDLEKNNAKDIIVLTAVFESLKKNVYRIKKDGKYGLDKYFHLETWSGNTKGGVNFYSASKRENFLREENILR